MIGNFLKNNNSAVLYLYQTTNLKCKGEQSCTRSYSPEFSKLPAMSSSVSTWFKVTLVISPAASRYLEKLYGMFPKGDFFTLEQAESLIVSSKYSKTIKNNLIKFIRIIAKSNMDVAKTKLSYNTYRRYLNLLGDLGINPITIPDDCGLQYIKSPFTFPSPTVSTIPSAST